MKRSKKSEVFIILSFVVLIAISISTMIQLSNNISERSDIIVDELRERIRLHGDIVSGFFSREIVDEIQTEQDLETQRYRELEVRLQNYAIENAITYLYFARQIERGGVQYIQYVWDTDQSERRFTLNELFCLEDKPNIQRAFQGEYVFTDLGVYAEGWEGLISTYRPVYGEDGTLIGVLIIDISDRRIMEASASVQNALRSNILGISAIMVISAIIIITYKKKIKEVEEANAAKTHFLSKMSHELRTPLTAVIGMLNMIDKSNDLEKIKSYYVVKMKIASQNLLQNINDILDISKIEEGKMSILKYRFNIEDMFRSVFDVMEMAASEKKIDIHINMQANMPKYFKGDTKRLMQVYMNLLSNAIKFTNENGAIYVYVRYKDLENGSVEITSEVSDNGIGIPSNKMSSLFQNFSQVDNGLSRKYTGSGIGLVIVKSIVELMGGTISVQSEEGKGTTFSFNFVLEKSADQEESEIGTDIFNVLVIDDAEETCNYISDLFQAKNIKHKVALSGEAGITLVEEEKEMGSEFNVILVDYIMPGMNGIETVNELNKHVSKDVLIMMISSIDWSNIEEEAKAVGITKFLQKPLLPSDIVNAMSEVAVKKLCRYKKVEEEIYDFSGKTILLIEDNATNREVAQFILEDTGVVCDEAEDGVIGVNAYKENPEKYDLILMDIQMPNMDGFEATKRIRDSKTPNAKNIPIIAMTANVFMDQIAEALDAGMNGHIGKPIDSYEMKGIISKFL